MNASGFHQQSGTIKLNCDDWATKGIPQMTLSNYANSHSELCHVEFHQWRCFCVKNNSWGKHKSGFLKRFNWKSNTHSLEKKILFNLIYSGILQKVQTWSNDSLLSDTFTTAWRTKMKTTLPFSTKKLKLRISPWQTAVEWRILDAIRFFIPRKFLLVLICDSARIFTLLIKSWFVWEFFYVGSSFFNGAGASRASGFTGCSNKYELPFLILSQQRSKLFNYLI